MNAEIIISTAVGVSVDVAGFLLKRQFVDRTDRIESKIDELTRTVAEMATKNAEDHGDVVERIAKMEGALDSMRAPWNRNNQHQQP